MVFTVGEANPFDWRSIPPKIEPFLKGAYMGGKSWGNLGVWQHCMGTLILVQKSLFYTTYSIIPFVVQDIGFDFD